MKTAEFNRKYELQTTAGKGVRARRRNLPAQPLEIATADGETYDPAKVYYFFDAGGEQVRQTLGMRRDGEFVSACGMKIIEIGKLRVNRDGALADGQNFFRSRIESFQTKIEDYELEKSAKNRQI